MSIRCRLFMIFFLVIQVAICRPPLERSDTAKVNFLNRMATNLRESDIDAALKYSQEALSIAGELDYPRGKAEALGNMGWIHYRKTDFVQSLRYSFEAIKISEQIGLIAEIGRSRNNVAAIFFEQKQYEKALDEFRKALKIGRVLKDGKLLARTFNNIGYTYLMGVGNLDSAKWYGQEGLKASEVIREGYLAAFALRTLGDVASQRGDLKEAISLLQRAKAISENGRNHSMRAAIDHRLAKAYIERNQLEDAKALLLRNVDVALRMGFREELERTYKVLADLHYQQGEGTKAYEYLTKYTVLHDSIYNDRSSEQLALAQSKFDLDLKQAEIELLTKDSVMKQDEITRQRMQLYITILAATSAFLLVILLLYGFQKSKRVNRELEDQKKELARKNEEIHQKQMELSRLNATKDKLFSIIGHDFRSPMHSLKGLLNLIGTKNMSQDEFELFAGDLRKKIDVVYDNLDNILNWSVTQLKGIQTNPTLIQPNSLADEVCALYDEMARLKRVELINEIDRHVLALADKDQVRLVMRNLVSNALKFTQADGYVKLSSQTTDDYVHIFVEDTGIGMSSGDLQRLFVKDQLWSVHGTNNEKGLGLGLLLCKEFIEKNKGELTVTSEQGVGTTFRFTLPLSHDRHAAQPVEAKPKRSYEKSPVL